MGISAIVIALNEEKNIRDCLGSLKWADELIVVDSGSSDRTVEIAKNEGARVFYRRFDNFMDQRNYAIEQATQDWIFFVDADERVNEDLANEVEEVIASTDSNGCNVLRRNFIFGKEMRFGGHQGDKHLRLLRKGSRPSYEGIVHEKASVEGMIVDLKNPLLHYSTPTVEEYMRKLELYTDLEASYLKRSADSSGRKVPAHYLILKPVAKFLKQYFFQLGFLDGIKGFNFYSLSAYNVFMKYRKYFDLVKKEGEDGNI